MKNFTFVQKSLSLGNKGLFVLFAGIMSFGAYAQKVPVRASSADERWQKGGIYDGFRPEQEVVSKRTKNAKHFKNADGSYTAQIGKTVHYLDNSGRWQDIKLDLVKSGNAFVNETNSFRTKLPLNSDAPVTMKLDNTVNFSWWMNPEMQFVNNGNVVKTLKAAKVAGTSGKTNVQYKGVYPNVTEEFEMLENGIENNTILNSLPANVASMPKSATMVMRQFIPLQAGWKVQNASGDNMSSKFEAGMFHIAIPGSEDGIYFGSVVTFDNTLTKNKAFALLSTPENKLSKEQKAQLKNHVYVANYTIDFVDGGIEVAIAIPVKWLQEGSRAYPVTIDPTVTITPTGAVGNFYGPLSHWYGFQRHANLYLASELNLPPAQITAIELNKTGTQAARTKPTTVYLNTASGNTLTAGAAWNSPTYTGGLTPVFDGNTTQDATAGWKMITFTNPYVYTPGNLLVMIKDIYGGSGSAQYFNMSPSVTGRQAYKRVDTTDPGESTTLGVENYLPEMRFTYTPLNVTCAAPVSVSTQNVTSSAATVNWVPPASAPADGYEYIVSTSSTMPADNATPTGTTAAGVTTVNIAVNPATVYYIFVRSVCGTDKSYWVSTSITTPCAAFNAPFLQEFTSGTMPLCWTNTSTNGAPNALWKFSGFVEYDNGNTRPEGTFAWVDGSDPSAGVNDVTLTSPVINLAGLTVPELVFDYFSNSSSTTYPNNIFTVQVFDGVNWNTVYTDNTSLPAWRTERVSLAAYAGTSIQVRFIVDKTAAAAGFAFYNDILLDNVIVQETPSCLPPSQLAASLISDVQFTLTWEAPSVLPAGGFEFEVRSSGAAGSGATGLVQTGTVANTVESQVITGLTENTPYTVYVRSICAVGNESAWVPLSVQTIPQPPANNECMNAIALTVNPDYSCGTTTAATTANATQSMAATPCSGNPDDDVWFSFVATGDAHRITIANKVAVVGTSTDMYFQVLSGECDALASVLCSDADQNELTGLTPGETYYVRAYTYGTTSRNTFTICVGTPPPAPVNDDCEGAIELTVNPDYSCAATMTGTTVSATNYMDAAPCTGNPDDDVFYRFTATAESHKITISGVTAVVGTSTDMYFQVLDGICGSFESLLCSDPNDNVVTGLTPGSEYYIRVYSVSATARQNFTICVGTPPGPPANDDCEGAVTLTVNADLACGVTATGTTASATNYMDAAPCSGNPDDDVFFKFVATGPTHRIVLSNVTAVVGTSTDIYFQVLEGTCGLLTSLHCSDPNDSFVSGLTAGETYYIRVYSYAANAGQNFTICVGTPTAPAPGNDECAGAVSLTVSPTATCAAQTAGTTAGSSQSMAAAPCIGTADDDVWYSFVATNAVHTITLSGVTAVAGGTSTDANFQVLNGSCATPTSLFCSDPNSATIGGFVAGQLYYVRVYSGASTTQIAFNICVTTPAITTPANDDCATAIALTPGAVFGTNPLVVSNTNATASMLAPLPGCASYSGGDVWYTVAVPASGSITVETNSNTGGTVADSGLALYSGACGTLTLVECDDDDSTDGNFSKIALTGRTPGEVLYIRTWEYGNDTAGTWKISAYDGSLGSEQFVAGSFRHYPNPVKDVLNISYVTDITSVKVFNLLGQEVLAKDVNAAETAVDMSSLTDGAYIVLVTVGDSVNTFKVIKKQ
jgi:hypothetical protein